MQTPPRRLRCSPERSTRSLLMGAMRTGLPGMRELRVEPFPLQQQHTHNGREGTGRYIVVWGLQPISPAFGQKDTHNSGWWGDGQLQDIEIGMRDMVAGTVGWSHHVAAVDGRGMRRQRSPSPPPHLPSDLPRIGRPMMVPRLSLTLSDPSLLYHSAAQP